MTRLHPPLIAAALLAAPFAAASADVPTKLGEPEAAQAPDRALEDALRAMREAMFPAGERVEGWDVGGADIEAHVRALGADRHYVLESDASDGSALVGIFTDRPIADLAPPAWRVVESFGSAEAKLENPTLAFGYLSARYVLAARSANRRLGSAYCSDRMGHAILYDVPGAPATAGDEDMLEFVAGLMLAVEGQTVCSRYDGDPDKGYSVRNFFPDGRLLLNPDRSVPAGRATIVPAAPIDSLIEPPPPSPVTQPR